MKTTSRFAIAAAASFLVGGFALTPAKAADLGGDCCADLEERVAELEATTVRKGNRKVSVTLYGRVSEGIMWYDNGEESDVYVGNLDYTSNRIGAKGSGNIREGLDVGYQLELGVGRSTMSSWAEDDEDDNENISVRQLEINVTHAQLGKLKWGTTYSATDGAQDPGCVGAAGVACYNNSVGDTIFSFSHIDTSTGTEIPGLNWGSTLDGVGPGGRFDGIVYESPTLQGFTFSSSWGEDDFWDVNLAYSKEWNGISMAARVGYSERQVEEGDNVDPDQDNPVTFIGEDEPAQTIGANLLLYHSPSGLWGAVGYAQRDFAAPEGVDGGDADNIWTAIGINYNWTGMGATAIWGEYQQTQDLFPGIEVNAFSVGFGQDIDAIGANAFVKYSHAEADLDAATFGDLAVEDFSAITAGMVVYF